MKSRMQSNQIDCQVSEGCDFRPKIAQIACDGILESQALQLSKAPSFDQIAQGFPSFLGTFQTEHPKWSYIYDPSRKAVKHYDLPIEYLNQVEYWPLSSWGIRVVSMYNVAKIAPTFLL